MSLVSYNELCEFVERGIIRGVDFKDINGTSIDVYLAPLIKVERSTNGPQVVSLMKKERLAMSDYAIPEGGFYDLRPKGFILAATVEKFYLPDNISAEFKLNSSGARIGLENALATWCDPWWNDSSLTLELANLTEYHTIRLDYGVRIGQMIFHKSEPVPKNRGYAVRGRYNGDHGVQEVKGGV